MVIQQINLYQPIFRKEQKMFSFAVLLQICGIITLALALMYGWGSYQTQQLQVQLNTLEVQLKTPKAKIKALNQRLRSTQPPSPLEHELALLEQELVTQYHGMELLKNIHDKSDRSISEFMKSFSRQLPRGAWLTGFEIQNGGDTLIIRGSALKPALVPQFIQQLSNEASLRGIHFNTLKIDRNSLNKDYIDFVISTDRVITPDVVLELVP